MWWREGRQLFYSKEKKKRVLSKSKVDFLILFACSIPSTAAGGSLYMSFIHSFHWSFKLGLNLSIASLILNIGHRLITSIGHYSRIRQSIMGVYRPKSLPKLDFRCSPADPSGGEGVGKPPGRGGGAGGRACDVFGFWAEGAGGRAVA